MTADAGAERVEFDVFISHAREDKDDFVRPLAQVLETKRLRPWYDEFTLRPGDSLRRSVDHGLLTSQAGIVVLSPTFFAKRWEQCHPGDLGPGRRSRDVKTPLHHSL